MKLLFLGDFFFDYPYLPKDFLEICSFVQQKNYRVIVNLETVWGTSGKPVRKRGVHLRSSRQLIEALKQLNVIAVCLANNHTLDFGPEPLENLCQELTRAGILYVGAGRNLEQALKPLALPETSLLLQNFAWETEEAVSATKTGAGVAPLRRDTVMAQSRKLRKKYPDHFIVNIYHWGFEYNLLPNPSDIHFAHQSIDAGADMIIGHHPHVIQPYEKYKEKDIFYSLGNFYFASRRKNYNKHFPVPPCNACDFGLGIVFDTVTKQAEGLVSVEYQKAADLSSVTPAAESAVVRDITSVDWKSKDYIKKVREMSCNFTPVLTLNSFHNAGALGWLHFKYKMAFLLKFLKKSRLGNVVFEWAKKL
jgi:hypothetical protein